MNGDAVGSKNYSKMGQKAIVKRELLTTQLVPYQQFLLLQQMQYDVLVRPPPGGFIRRIVR